MRLEITYCEDIGGWLSSVYVGGHFVAGLPDLHNTQAEAYTYCAEYVLTQGYFQITGRFPLFHEGFLDEDM